MASLTSILVPDLGDFKSVDVVDVLVRVGDEIQVDGPLITLETDKATMDVPATVAGRVVEVFVKKGDKVAAGSAVVSVEVREGAPVAAAVAPIKTPVPAAVVDVAPPRVVPPLTIPVPAPRPTAASSPVAPPPALGDIGFSRAYASPSVRLLARELGVDLGRVSGSGPRQRITHDDVKAWVKRALAGGVGAENAGGGLPAVPSVDFAKFGPISVQPLSRIQKISGKRLHASWVNLPHVTQFDQADITALEDTRAALKAKAAAAGIKLTPLAFVLKACVAVLAQFPKFTASLDASGENLVFKQYLHLGFAADTPSGLVVPVLRDADRKTLFEIAGELAVLSEKARAGKLSAADMQGGCFTVSSLGGIGGTAFTPIINAPEVAILGVSRSSLQPVYINGAFVPRLMLPLSLSYDHRVIDGADAARFTTALGAALADMALLTAGIV